MALTQEDKLLVVTMELLRKQLGDNSIAVAANTKRTEEDFQKQAQAAKDFMDGKGANVGGKPDYGTGGVGGAAKGGPGIAAVPGLASAGSAITGVLGMVTAKFAAIVGPLALMGQVLSAPISGFQVLSSSVRVLASTLAPVLLPITLALSAGLLALSDVVNEQLMDGFDEFAEFVLSTAIPAMVTFIQSVSEAATMLKEWAKDLGVTGNPEEDFLTGLAGTLDTLLPGAGLGDLARTAVGGGGGGTGINDALQAGGDTESAKKKVDSGLRDALTSLRNSLGPRASANSLDSVGRSAQLAALNADPLEARLMKQQIAVLERIEKAVSRRANASAPYTPGAGDFRGDLGAGGDGGGGDF